MFSKELSSQLGKIISKREMTVETLANAAGLTREYVTNIKNGKQVPTLTSFEKLCSALEVEPNDLLLNEKSLEQNKSSAKPVTLIYCPERRSDSPHFPVCPTCNSLLHSDWESYCSFCGQKLSWMYYTFSKVTYDKPRIKKESRGYND